MEPSTSNRALAAAHNRVRDLEKEVRQLQNDLAHSRERQARICEMLSKVNDDKWDLERENYHLRQRIADLETQLAVLHGSGAGVLRIAGGGEPEECAS